MADYKFEFTFTSDEYPQALVSALSSLCATALLLARTVRSTPYRTGFGVRLHKNVMAHGSMPVWQDVSDDH